MPTSGATDDTLDRAARDIRDAVNACRKVMIDLPLAHKNVVLNELHRWVEAERGTYEPLQ